MSEQMRSGQGTPPLKELRRLHEQRVIETVCTRGAVTRGELVAALGLSSTTVSDIVRGLIEIGLFCQEPVPMDRRGRGRPTLRVQLDSQAARLIGVELALGQVSAAIADLSQVPLGVAAAEPPAPFRLDAACEVALELVDRLVAAHPGRVAALSVGLPLPRSVGYSVAEGGAQVAEKFTTHLGIVPLLDNNCRLIALAEAQWGAGAGFDDLAYLQLDHGIGGGLVMHRRLVEGVRGGGAEFGHICVDPCGPSCHCGGRGCLERYAGLAEILAASGVSNVDTLAARLERDHLPAVDQAALRVAQAIASILTVVDLQRIVLGGRVAQLPGFVECVARDVRKLAAAHSKKSVTLARAMLGEQACARGGIALALRSSSLLDAQRS